VAKLNLHLQQQQGEEACGFENTKFLPSTLLMTESARSLLRELVARSSIRFEELEGRVDDARTLIALGAAKLVVAQKPWGMEFALEPS
jgi:hypothetical protein